MRMRMRMRIRQNHIELGEKKYTIGNFLLVYYVFLFFFGNLSNYVKNKKNIIASKVLLRKFQCKKLLNA